MSTFIPLVANMPIPAFMCHTLGVSIGGVPLKLVEGPLLATTVLPCWPRWY